jgi:hypothetical protein
VYIRPDVDIIYLPDLFTLDVRPFIMENDNQLAVKNLALNPTFIWTMTMRRMTGDLIRSMFNLKNVYAIEGKMILSEFNESRASPSTVVLRDVEKGSSDPNARSPPPPWNSGYVDAITKVYRRVTNEEAAYGDWTVPKLICREVVRERREDSGLQISGGRVIFQGEGVSAIEFKVDF